MGPWKEECDELGAATGVEIHEIVVKVRGKGPGVGLRLGS